MQLRVKVIPNAKRREMLGFQDDGSFKIKLMAPPDKGRANRELITYLSDLTGLSKQSIIILKGETSRNKLIELKNFSEDELRAKLE